MDITVYILFIIIHLVFTQDYSCYDFQFKPRVCLPGPEDVVRKGLVQASPHSTCGSPPSNYCRSTQPSGCYICNSSSSTEKHPTNFIADKHDPTVPWRYARPTWWQSITWWDAKQRLLLVNNTLKVKISVSLNKTYDLTGSIRVTFYSSKPHAFVFERSSDYGQSWAPYRYYADDCARRFMNIPKIMDIKSAIDVYCLEDKNVNVVSGSQVVFKPYYTRNNFWLPKTQSYLKMTDIRISLEYPWTDGNEIINQESFLNKYYFDITDLQVLGRCHCNGHALYCYHDARNIHRCNCQHNADGVDCEKCLPLYNNKEWKAAEASNIPNPCEG